VRAGDDVPVLRSRTRTRGVAAAALLVVALALATAPFVPLLDPDEGYYPATAAESVDAGRPWDPQINGEPRWDKPILTYALIEMSFAVFGRSVTAARLPSALEAGLLVWLTGLVTAWLAGSRAGTLTAWVLASTLGVGLFGRAAHPELAVVLGITAADLCLALYLAGATRFGGLWLGVLAGMGIGYGTLAKGPVAIALPILTLAVCVPLLRERLPKPRQGLVAVAVTALVAAAIALPWYVAMTLRHGTVFLTEAIWHHNVTRYASRSFGHTAGFWYFLLPLAVLLLPWTAFLPASLAGALRAPRDDRGVLARVMTAAGLTAFVFYSLSASKLPHYALAFVPPFAVTIGMWLDGTGRGAASTRRAATATAWVMAAAALVLGSAPWVIGTFIRARDVTGGSPTSGLALRELVLMAAWPTALLLLACAALLAVWRSRWPHQLVVLGAAGVLLPLVLVTGAAPLLHATYQWDRLGRAIPRDGRPVFLVGPRAPSLTFFAARPVTRLTSDELQEALNEHPDAWIVVDTRWLQQDAASRLGNLVIDVVDDRGTMAVARVRPKAPRVARRARG
jgi:4-amino-4-deoxy-L-arabinose transferase-like glycosyltransferase